MQCSISLLVVHFLLSLFSGSLAINRFSVRYEKEIVYPAGQTIVAHQVGNQKFFFANIVGDLWSFDINTGNAVAFYNSTTIQQPNSLIISQNGKYLISAYASIKRIAIHDVNSLEMIAERSFDTAPRAILPWKSSIIFLQDSSSKIYVIDPVTLNTQKIIVPPYKQKSNCTLSISKDENLIVQILENNDIILIDVDTYSVQWNFTQTYYPGLNGYSWPVLLSTGFSWDNSTVMIGDIFGTVIAHSRLQGYSVLSATSYQELKSKQIMFIMNLKDMQMIGTLQEMFFYDAETGYQRRVILPSQIPGTKYLVSQNKRILRIGAKTVVYQFTCQNLSYYDSRTISCISCHPICVACDGLTGKCTLCAQGFYVDTNGGCQGCIKGCADCTQEKCLKCSKDFSISDLGHCSLTGTLKIGAAALASFPLLAKSKALKFQMIMLDEIWLYVYANRTYSQQIYQIFTSIIQIEDSKWAFLDFDKLIPINNQNLPISDYSIYSRVKHLQIQKIDDTFWKNSFSFFIYTIPTMLLMFIAIRFLFYLFFNWQWSAIIRPFAFSGFFLLLVYEGNIQYLTYLGFNQLSMFFAFQFIDKFSHALFLFAFFLVCVYCFASFVLIRAAYKDLSKYFVQSINTTVFSLLMWTTTLNIRCFLRGAILSVGYANFPLQMLSLACVQLLIVIIILITLGFTQSFLSVLFAYSKIIHSLIFVLFDIFLYVDWYCQIQFPQDLEMKAMTASLVTGTITCLIINSFFRMFVGFVPEPTKETKIQNMNFEGLSGEQMQSLIFTYAHKLKVRDAKPLENIDFVQGSFKDLEMDFTEFMCIKQKLQNPKTGISASKWQNRLKKNWRHMLKDQGNGLKIRSHVETPKFQGQIIQL